MQKRDYKNYNILNDEIEKEELEEDINRIGQVSKQEEKVIDRQEVNQEEIIDKTVDREDNKKVEEITDRQENKEEDKKKNQEVDSLNQESIESNFFNEEKKNQHQSHIPAYKRFYKQKERGIVFKWLMRLAILALTIMLLPLIGLLAGVILGILGTFLAVVVASIGTGFIILGSICFMSTQVSASLIALGISAAITALSFGGIVLIIFILLVKWIWQLIKRFKRPHIKQENGGGN